LARFRFVIEADVGVDEELAKLSKSAHPQCESALLSSPQKMHIAQPQDFTRRWSPRVRAARRFTTNAVSGCCRVLASQFPCTPCSRSEPTAETVDQLWTVARLIRRVGLIGGRCSRGRVSALGRSGARALGRPGASGVMCRRACRGQSRPNRTPLRRAKSTMLTPWYSWSSKWNGAPRRTAGSERDQAHDAKCDTDTSHGIPRLSTTECRTFNPSKRGAGVAAPHPRNGPSLRRSSTRPMRGLAASQQGDRPAGARLRWV